MTHPFFHSFGACNPVELGFGLLLTLIVQVEIFLLCFGVKNFGYNLWLSRPGHGGFSHRGVVALLTGRSCDGRRTKPPLHLVQLFPFIAKQLIAYENK